MEDNTRPIPIVPWGNQEPLQPLKAATLKAIPSERIEVRTWHNTTTIKKTLSGACSSKKELCQARIGSLRFVRLFLRKKLSDSEKARRKSSVTLCCSDFQINKDKSFNSW